MELFVSLAAIKFTAMWLLMSVFILSMEKIESTDATEGTGEEFPVNRTPVVETPSAAAGTPFDFSPLWKLIPPSPPYSATSLHISQPHYDRPRFTAQNGALFKGQPTRCLLIQGFLPFVFNPVWTFSSWDAKASKMLCLCQRSRGGVWGPPQQIWKFNLNQIRI